MRPDGPESRRADAAVAVVLLVYTAVVHGLDTLAAQNGAWGLDGSLFRWQSPSGFDYFKFLAWLVVPLVILGVLGRVDKRYFGFGRAKRSDLYALLALIGAGFVAVALIRVVPGLGEWYPGLGDLPWERRLDYARYQLLWTASWLVGWEFLHRYALLTSFTRLNPRYGWLVAPLVEGLYHLQKHWLEMLGMVFFSVLLTQWALRRRTVLLPFLAHLAIELELLVVQLISPGPR